jgi:hypothetical protein
MLPPSPAVRLRQILAAARADGLPFLTAWYPAVARAVMLYPERDVWLKVFADETVRERHQRAYELVEPISREVALRVVRGFVAEIGEDPGVDACALPGCDRQVVRRDGRQVRKIYCCDDHRRQAARQRERVA